MTYTLAMRRSDGQEERYEHLSHGDLARLARALFPEHAWPDDEARLAAAVQMLDPPRVALWPD